MNSAVNVFATFDIQTFTLNVFRAGSGSGTVTSAPAGINCGADCVEPYGSGTTVTLTATPSAGSTFAGWSNGCVGTGTCTVTMNNAVNVNATFNVQTFILSIAFAGSGSGTVTSTPAGINCSVGPSGTCSMQYFSGTLVTLTATPAAGSTFTGWTGGGCVGTGTCTVSMTASKPVVATLTSP
jgi:hypothetical protein